MPINRWYENFESAQSNGTLPNKKPAKAMRYKRAFIWQITAGGVVGGGVYKGKFKVDITNQDGSIAYFSSYVHTKLLFYAQGIFFTWNYLGDDFDTTLCAGAPTTKETIGRYLDSKKDGDLEQGDLQPASGEGAFLGDGAIIADWYSPLYYFDGVGGELLPPNSKVVISHDTWDLGPASVEYGWAFLEGQNASLGTTFDPYGALLTARGAYDGERIFTGRAWRGDYAGGDYGFLDAGGAVKGTNPMLHHLRDGRQLMTLKTDDGVVEMLSHNSEWSWKRAKYPNAEAGVGTSEQPIFGPNASMPISLLIDNDSRIHLAVDGPNLFSRLVAGEELGDKIRVGEAGDGAFSIERDATGTVFIIGSKGRPLWKSHSIPPRWEPIAQPQEAS